MNITIKRFAAAGAVAAALPLSMLTATAASAQAIHPARAASASAVHQLDPPGALIQNARTRLCLEEGEAGAVLEVPCEVNSPFQRWEILAPGQATDIQNVATGKCLSGFPPGGEVSTISCALGTTRWRLAPAPNRSVRIIAQYDFPDVSDQYLTSNPGPGIPTTKPLLIGPYSGLQDWNLL